VRGQQKKLTAQTIDRETNFELSALAAVSRPSVSVVFVEGHKRRTDQHHEVGLAVAKNLGKAQAAGPRIPTKPGLCPIP